MKFSKIVFSGFVVGAFLLSACGSEKTDMTVHYSPSGLVPEAYLPADLGMVASYSSLDDEQFTALQAIERDLGDADRVSRTASDTLNAQFGEVGLDFERDLKPAFGEQFRLVYGVRSTEEAESFTVITLADSEQMKTVLQTLVDADQLAYKKLSNMDTYVDEEARVYVALYGDLFLMANTPENLVEMMSLNEKDSLWGAEAYQATLEQVGSNAIFYAALYPSLYGGDLDLAGGFSVSDIPSVIDRQVLAVRAEEDGFNFEAWVTADPKKAKEAGVSFDAVPSTKPYLFKEVPMEGLMAYYESYGLKQTFEQAEKLGDDTSTLEGLRESVRTYFGMDFDEDIMTFLDKGFALVAHKNGESVIPGITLYMDVSSNVDSAESFMDKLDGQLTGLITALGSALPGLLNKDTVNVGDTTFSRITVNLKAVPSSAESPLPTVLTDSPIQLMYGVRGDRLIVSTASNWDFEAASIADSDLYKKLNAKLKDVEDGLVLLDATGVADFVGALRALREDLSLDVSEEALELEGFFEGFSGAIIKSRSTAYESYFNGFLMLAD